MTSTGEASTTKAERDDRLVWVSVATTSGDSAAAHLLEVALVVTDNQLATVAEMQETVLAVDAAQLGSMDADTRSRHDRTGLLSRIPEVGVSVDVAEAQILKVLEAHCEAGSTPLCGHEVWKARDVLRRLMPKVVDHLHYRLVELTTIEALSERWYPGGPAPLDLEISGSPLRANAEVHRAIERLRAYREQVMRGVAELQVPRAEGDQA